LTNEANGGKCGVQSGEGPVNAGHARMLTGTSNMSRAEIFHTSDNPDSLNFLVADENQLALSSGLRNIETVGRPRPVSRSGGNG
jgi:hypothetical protein